MDLKPIDIANMVKSDGFDNPIIETEKEHSTTLSEGLSPFLITKNIFKCRINSIGRDQNGQLHPKMILVTNEDDRFSNGRF